MDLHNQSDRKKLGYILITLSGLMAGLDLMQLGIDLPMDIITVIMFIVGSVLVML